MQYEIITQPIISGNSILTTGMFVSRGILYIVVPPGIDPQTLIHEHQDWIDKKLKKVRRHPDKLQRISQLAQKRGLIPVIRQEEPFHQLLLELFKAYQSELGVKVHQIQIRKMRSRWGSCNTKGHISIRNQAIELPDPILQYLVFHEVAHLREPNHSPRFWKLLEAKFPDYKELRKVIKHWDLLFHPKEFK